MDKINDLTLLVMAAGTGTRYGGLKQIVPVGPNGETIIDYSVYDAVRAGFQKVVFVIRREIEMEFRRVFDRRFDGIIAVDYVFQDAAQVGGTPSSQTRQKPWGTAHAVLAAAHSIHGPFAVVNGDDFYGTDSFSILSAHLSSGGNADAMVGFVLRETMTEFGGVKRGVCQTSVDGFLRSVTELVDVKIQNHGASGIDSVGVVHDLTGDEIVSMNMWGFQRTLFPLLQEEWLKFVNIHGHDETVEFYIPDFVTSLIKQEKIVCRVLRTAGSWFGMTYSADHSLVVERIGKLVDQGQYPEKLWS